jgi:hypothetical protein
VALKTLPNLKGNIELRDISVYQSKENCCNMMDYFYFSADENVRRIFGLDNASQVLNTSAWFDI